MNYKQTLQSQIGGLYFQKARIEQQIEQAEAQLALLERIEKDNYCIAPNQDKITAEGIEESEAKE